MSALWDCNYIIGGILRGYCGSVSTAKLISDFQWGRYCFGGVRKHKKENNQKYLAGYCGLICGRSHRVPGICREVRKENWKRACKKYQREFEERRLQNKR